MELLREALAYSFDQYIGHDYVEDWAARYDFYHDEQERIPFKLDMMNKVTKGGFPRKTANFILAGTNVGKTLIMCDWAANNLLDGWNVLYVTGEMSEERICERIDSNLLDIPMDQVEKIPREQFENRMNKLITKTAGKLIVQEYPTASASMGHIRHLLHELELKKGFVPDVIYLDYLNLFTSQRFKEGTSGTYAYFGSVAQEFRGLMVEKNMVGISATQLNREGFAASDFGLEKTSDSMAVTFIADGIYGVIQTEDLETLGQYKVKQLKTRYGDKTQDRSFIIGVDMTKMRLYNVNASAQENITEASTPTFPNFPKKSFDFSDIS